MHTHTYEYMYEEKYTCPGLCLCMFVVERLLPRQHTLPFSQVMYTVKEYMQTVTAVDPYWLAECLAYRSPA